MRKTEGFQQSSSALEASQLFNLAKHEFARITGNTQVAEWALDVAVGEAESAHDRLSLASVHRTSKACVEYGSHLLVHVHRPQTSVIWLRRAIKLLERMEGGNLPQVTDLQAEALRKLARAFYQHALALPADEAQRSDALMSAEATLKELQRIYESIGSPLARDPRMTLLLLNIVGTRQGSMRRLLDLTKSLCGHEGPIDEHAVSCVLSLVRERSAQDIELLSELLDTLTEKLLQHTAEQADCIVRVLLTALTMCKNPATTTVAQSIIAKLERANYTVGKDGSFAAQMLLWKYADGRLQLAQPDRLLAATLYRMAAHPIFASADRNTAKSLRKATLCYLEAGDLTRAKETLYECPGHLADDALNHYLRFAILARSGREEEATAALEALMGAPNFTSSILPSVVKLAQDSGVQQALYHTLRSIAARAQTDSTLSSSVDLVVLTRCLIKQVLPGEIKHSMDTGTAKTLLSYFESNLHALQKEASRDVRDRRTCLEAQWSYKTAYNAAVALSSHIDPELTACFFDMALSLAKVREGLVAEPVESPDFQTTKVWAKLPAIVARAMGARDTERNIETPDRRIMWFKIKDETEEAFQLVTDAQVVAQSSELLKEVRWALVLLQYEAIVNLHDWVAATSCFELQAANGKVPLSILEAMTDLTWADPRAPDTLLCRLLQASIEGLKSRLNVSKGQGVQSQQSQDVARLARWIRALVSFTLSSKTTTARSAMVTNAQAELSTSVRETHLEALSQIEDAVAFLAEGRNDEPGAVLSDKTAATTLNANYPDDEKAWLVATAWDTGVELYQCVCGVVERRRGNASQPLEMNAEPILMMPAHKQRWRLSSG